MIENQRVHLSIREMVLVSVAGKTGGYIPPRAQELSVLNILLLLLSIILIPFFHEGSRDGLATDSSHLLHGKKGLQSTCHLTSEYKILGSLAGLPWVISPCQWWGVGILWLGAPSLSCGVGEGKFSIGNDTGQILTNERNTPDSLRHKRCSAGEME